MDDWLPKLAVAILATWRISAWLWYEHDAQEIRGWLCRWPLAAKQVSCFWCVTSWVSVPVVLVAWLWWWALVPFALSGAAILLSGGGRILWREMVEEE